jgi:hypothetical protein
MKKLEAGTPERQRRVVVATEEGGERLISGGTPLSELRDDDLIVVTGIPRREVQS